MNNEKIMILKMLERREITSEEAAKLLSAVNSTETVQNDEVDDAQNNYTNYTSNNFDYNNKRSYYDSPRQSSSNVIDDIAKSVSEKIISFAKGKKNTYGPKNNHYRPAQTNKDFSNRTNGIQKTFEIKINSSDNQLNLKSFNGDIFLKGYNGDKLSGKILYKPRVSNAEIGFSRLGTKYYLNCDEDKFDFICIDVFVPEKLFNTIIIDGDNGKVDIATITSQYFIIRNQDGDTILKDIVSDKLEVICNKNNLNLNNIKAKDGHIENFNGEMNLYNVDVEKLKIDIFNSNLTVSMENFDCYNEYLWDVESSNGKIYINLPKLNDIGYYLNARTNLSTVRVSVVGLNYLANDQNFIEAQTINYDSFEKHVVLKLETSNAPLVIS